MNLLGQQNQQEQLVELKNLEKVLQSGKYTSIH